MFQSWALTHPWELFIIGFMLGCSMTAFIVWAVERNGW